MKRLLALLFTVLLAGCGRSGKYHNGKMNTIEIGDYLFDFPYDFKLTEEDGIDSQVGQVKGDSLNFGFDFGYYSNSFEITPQEYLNTGDWRFYLPNRFMKIGMTYDQSNMPKVDVVSIRPAIVEDSSVGKGCDYIARCKHDTTEFDYPVYIPDKIKQTNFSIDTIDNLYRKIVWAKDPKKGATGMYIKDLGGFNKSINSYLALSIAAYPLNKEQQQTVIRIFRTARRKIEKK